MKDLFKLDLTPGQSLRRWYSALVVAAFPMAIGFVLGYLLGSAQ